VFGDYSNARVRKIDAIGNMSTIAGTGAVGYSGDGGPATAAELKNPNKVAFDACGNIYVTDIGAMNIRKITLPNRAPAFVLGHHITFGVCENMTTSVDSILASIDSDNFQINTWAVITAPTHGTLVGTSTIHTTGGAIRPVGISYTPTTGYSGPDSFRVQVTDCDNTSDTATVVVSVNNCALQVNPLTGKVNEGVNVYPNPALKGEFTMNLSSAFSEDVHYIITNLVGEKIKDVTAISNTPVDVQLNAASGVYFISANTAHGNWSTKIVVAAE